MLEKAQHTSTKTTISINLTPLLRSVVFGAKRESTSENRANRLFFFTFRIILKGIVLCERVFVTWFLLHDIVRWHRILREIQTPIKIFSQ